MLQLQILSGNTQTLQATPASVPLVQLLHLAAGLVLLHLLLPAHGGGMEAHCNL